MMKTFRNMRDASMKDTTYEIHADGRDVAFSVRVIGETE